MSTKIKICGITNLQDAEAAVEAGADALGFVFYTKSPRAIEPAVAKRIIANLPPFVLPVGVFVNHDLATIKNVFDECGLALAQLHGNETPTFCESLGRPVLRALRLRDRRSLLALAEYKGRVGIKGFVIDAFSEQAYGGTGQTVDWSLAREVASVTPIILAGGLTPINVQEAIQHVQPYGVDVSSGVEESPQKKDHEKIHAFTRAVRLEC